MDWRELPSLNSLRAFVAVADAQSMSGAGDALGVTQAAVGQQIRTLEARLGVALIERVGRSITLTDEGRRFAARLRDGFQTISGAVEALTESDATRPVQISMTPMFAVNWLMPRISDFHHKHPEIELMLNPTPELVDLRPGGVDLAIRSGAGEWPGLDAELLLETDFVVVAETALVNRLKLETPADLVRAPWLQELGTNEVSQWLSDKGVIPTERLTITSLPGFMALDGVRNGDGVAATARSFVESDVKAGRLTVLFDNARNGFGYYIVTRPGVMRPPLKTFVKWLRRQV